MMGWLRARPRVEMPHEPALTVEEALATLLPDVRRWLHRLLGPGADLDDATQDALIELAKALSTFESRSSLRTFAYTIVVRSAYRSLAAQKKRQRETALELVPPPSSELDPESRAMHREALKRLYGCLDRLPVKRRVAFVLCAVEGLTPEEAAQIEGTSAVTMRSRVFHARREIERRLAHDPYVSRLIASREEVP